jgi:hypothetical protein
MNSSLFSKSKLTILSTLIAIILVSMLSGSTNTITTNSTTISKQQALAQTNDNSTFNLYENPTFGIRIQYPSDWEKVEPGQISHESSFNKIVGFVSPKESVSDTSPPPALSIGMHNLSSSSSYQNTTLDQYTDVHINAIRREQASLLESTRTILKDSNNNNLAHSAVYINNLGQEVMQVWTIKENKAYHITYAADVARYPDYLPVAQKIIDSLEIGTMSTQEVQQQPPPTVESSNITTIKENNTATTTITTATPWPCCTSDRYNIANAGPDQTVLEGTIITLNGSSNSSNNKSSNIENTVKYSWGQTDGPPIILKGNNTAHPTFVAPNYPNNTKHTFALEVFDKNQVNNNNQTGSAIDTVDIIVKDVNLAAKNPRALQQEDVNIIKQADQEELQDEGTTDDDDGFLDDIVGVDDEDEVIDEDDDDVGGDDGVSVVGITGDEGDDLSNDGGDGGGGDGDTDGGGDGNGDDGNDSG